MTQGVWVGDPNRPAGLLDTQAAIEKIIELLYPNGAAVLIVEKAEADQVYRHLKSLEKLTVCYRPEFGWNESLVARVPLGKQGCNLYVNDFPTEDLRQSEVRRVLAILKAAGYLESLQPEDCPVGKNTPAFEAQMQAAWEKITNSFTRQFWHGLSKFVLDMLFHGYLHAIVSDWHDGGTSVIPSNVWGEGTRSLELLYGQHYSGSAYLPKDGNKDWVETSGNFYFWEAELVERILSLKARLKTAVDEWWWCDTATTSSTQPRYLTLFEFVEMLAAHHLPDEHLAICEGFRDYAKRRNETVKRAQKAWDEKSRQPSLSNAPAVAPRWYREKIAWEAKNAIDASLSAEQATLLRKLHPVFEAAFDAVHSGDVVAETISGEPLAFNGVPVAEWLRPDARENLVKGKFYFEEIKILGYLKRVNEKAKQQEKPRINRKKAGFFQALREDPSLELKTPKELQNTAGVKDLETISGYLAEWKAERANFPVKS